jgi:hypothetical protein
VPNGAYITIPICLIFCYSFIRNTSVSFFGHLPWTLKTSPNNTDHHSYSFLIYSLFYSYFSPRKAYISIFGNAYWTLEAVPDVATNSKHHPYFFCFFCFFLLFFICKSMHFYFWKCALDPESTSTLPPTVGTILTFFPVFFLLFYSYFSFVKAYISFFGNAP